MVLLILNATQYFKCPEKQFKNAAAKSLQLCPTLCDAIDGSPPGSPVPGILQARALECPEAQTFCDYMLFQSW